MNHNIALIAKLTLSILMIDLGLWGVAIDAAYRMDYPNTQIIALGLSFLLPFTIIAGLYKELRRAVAVSVLFISVLGLIYFIRIYGIVLLYFEMIGYTVLYLVAMVMLIKISINPYHQYRTIKN